MRLGQQGAMSLKRILLFDVNRILRFDLQRLDVGRVLNWDVGRALQWQIPPMLLKALVGYFLAAFALDVTGPWPRALKLTIAAATVAVAILPDLVRRMRARS